MDPRTQRFIAIMSQASVSLRKWAPDFTDRQTVMSWIEALRDIDLGLLEGVMRECVKTQDEFPSIAKIRRMAVSGTQLNEADMAEEVASRIESAISRYGYTNAEAAEEYIGELGWKVISMQGGWYTLCNMTNNELPSAKRSWRELARTLAKKAFLGELDKAPALPSGCNRNAIEGEIKGAGVGTLALQVANKLSGGKL